MFISQQNLWILWWSKKKIQYKIMEEHLWYFWLLANRSCCRRQDILCTWWIKSATEKYSRPQCYQTPIITIEIISNLRYVMVRSFNVTLRMEWKHRSWGQLLFWCQYCGWIFKEIWFWFNMQVASSRLVRVRVF